MSIQDIREKFCAFLKRCNAGISENVPVDVHELAPRFGVLSIDEDKSLSTDARIDPVPGGFRVRYATTDSRAKRLLNRQRFSIAHEFCHVYFYTKVTEQRIPEYIGPARSEEALCNYGAGCLLAPEWAIDKLGLEEPDLADLFEGARVLAISRLALGMRLIIDLNRWRATWLKCGWLEHPCPANHKSGEPALRVLKEFRPVKHRTFDGFIAAWKRIPEKSLIYKSWREGVPTRGVEKIDLGGLAGIFEIQVMPSGGCKDIGQTNLFREILPEHRKVDVLIT